MIPEVLTALRNDSSVNAPGVCYLLAIDKADITSMPDVKLLLNNISAAAATLSLSDIVLRTGGAMNEISNDNHSGTDIVEDEKPNNNAPFYTYEISLLLPNDKEETRGKIIRAYDKREWIIIARESTGAWRIFGSLERGCDFKSVMTTGAQMKGTAQIKMSFYWESPERALYLSPPNLERITITSAYYTSGIHTIGIVFIIHNFTGTNTGAIQLYMYGKWVTLTTYSQAPDVNSTYGDTSHTLGSGIYYARILSSRGVSSNVMTITV